MQVSTYFVLVTVRNDLFNLGVLYTFSVHSLVWFCCGIYICKHYVHLYIYFWWYTYLSSDHRWMIIGQVTLSKFHAWNYKFGSLISLLSLLRKLYLYRKRTVDGAVETENPEQNPEPKDNSVEALLHHLKNLQKGQHTFQLACSIVSDMRVRTLAYMSLVEAVSVWRSVILITTTDITPNISLYQG